MEEILRQIVERVSLDKKTEKSIKKTANDFLKDLKKIFPKNKVIFGGSFAKKTMIKKEEQDIDIFVVFNTENEMKNFKKTIEKNFSKRQLVHGSRDYFIIKKNNIIFEIIPLLKIKDKNSVKNVVDFSVFHVNYIKSQIKKNPGIIQEIKLAKAFCVAQEVYGAESYISGFSGYAIEVMICFFGNFINFLRKIQKTDFIDMEKHFRNKNEAIRNINKSKLESPLILIDPVYKYRNLCASLSEESFRRLKDSAKKFLDNPSADFFERKKMTKEDFLKETKEKKASFFSLELVCGKKNKDVAAAKMKKFFNFLKDELKRKEQEVLDSKFILEKNNRANIWFLIKENKAIKIFGPSISLKGACERFENERGKIFFEKGRAVAFENFNLKNFFEKQKKVANSMDVKILGIDYSGADYSSP